MPRPPLDQRQTDQALANYIAAREQAVRYVLSVLDPTASDAPARPYPDVLQRVQELIATEIGYYAESPTDTPPAQGPGQAEPEAPVEDAQEQEEHPHG